VNNDLLHPVFISTAYWISFILISISMSVLFNLRFYWTGLIPLISILISFIGGALVYEKRKEKNDLSLSVPKEVIYNKNIIELRIKILIFSFSIMGIIAIIIQLVFLNLPINNFNDILQLANKISVIRYSNQTDMPKYGLIFMAFLYSGSFLSGLYFVIFKGSKKICYLPIIIMLIYSLINGVKLGFIYSIVLWVTGYIGMLIFTNADKAINLKGIIKKMASFATAILLLIPLIQFFREGNLSRNSSFIASIISYFGSFNALSCWWNEYNLSLNPFKYTFSGLHNIFYEDRVVGLFQENCVIGYYNNNEIITNVYTIIRGLIDDFSIYGAIIIMFLIGYFMNFFYYKTKSRNIYAMLLLSMCFSILFCSIFSNMLNYNVILLSWFISFIFIYLVFNVSYKLEHV